MLSKDIVWDFVKKNGEKVEYDTGRVINKAME